VDPAVTAAIREFDPGLIPIWRVSLWVGPDRVERKLVHHGIGRYYPVPRYVRRPFRVEMPAGADFEAPNFLDAIFEDNYCLSYKMGGPGEYIPWDWGVYRWCREQFDRIKEGEYLKRLRKRFDIIAKLQKEHEEDIEYRKRQIEPYLLKQLEKVSEADWEKLAAWHAAREKAMREGTPVPERKEPKPMVAVGKAAGRSPRTPWETYGRVAPSRSQ
jgi:hypothetical protein